MRRSTLVLNRRRVLASIGTGITSVLAGCTDDGLSGDPAYEPGEVDGLEGDNRSADELTAAEALAEQESNDAVTPLDALSIRDHEFVLEDDYRGPTVQGTVENAGDDRIELVEVRVRVFGTSGAQLGRYLATTGDLNGNTTWEFQVVLLESPADIDHYDITVLGTPT